MRSILKGIIIVILQILLTLFIIFGFMYFIHLLKIIIYITSFAIHEPSIQLSIIIFILLSIMLLVQWYKKINWWIIFLYSFSFIFIAFPINIHLIGKRITNIAINKYNKQPDYVSLNFDIYEDYRNPHAVIRKNKTTYYWSFSENDFILNTNPDLHL